MTGRQVTISSKSATEPSYSRLGFREDLDPNRSVNEDHTPPCGLGHPPHFREIPLPKAAPRELEDAPARYRPT